MIAFPGAQVDALFDASRFRGRRRTHGLQAHQYRPVRIAHVDEVAMATSMRQSGIDVIGGMPWGTHSTVLRDEKRPARDADHLLQGRTGKPRVLLLGRRRTGDGGREARRALRLQVENLDRYEAEGRIEIVPAREWYLQDGVFDLHRVIRGWQEKLARALARGIRRHPGDRRYGVARKEGLEGLL